MSDEKLNEQTSQVEGDSALNYLLFTAPKEKVRDIVFPIPLTKYIATIKIPQDLSEEDAKKICGIVMALSNGA